MKINKRFISNLATYMLGLAIGLVLVGVIMQMKQKVFQQHQANQPTQQQAVPADPNAEGSP